MNARALWLALSCLAATARPIHAHDFPTPFRVLFAGRSSERLLVALRPGLALTEDGGAHWDYVCGAAIGIAGSEPYAVALSNAGNTLVGAFTALYADDTGGCNWAQNSASGLPARASALTPRDTGELDALIGGPAGPRGVFTSRDDGRSFALYGAPIEAARLTHFARSAADPDRVYVAGSAPDGSAALWVGEEALQRWTRRPLAGGAAVGLLALDPSDPDRLWLGRVTPEEPALADRIEESRDGGQSFHTLLELAELGGFASSEDGSTLFAGDRAGGLYRARAAGAFELVQPTLHVGCIEQRGEELWVCARDQAGLDPFAVGLSRDAGETFVPVLRSEQLRRLRTCGSRRVAEQCYVEWSQWKNDVFGSTAEPPLVASDAGERVPAAEPAAPPAPAEATPPARSARAARGCSAIAAGTPPLAGVFWLCLALVVGWAARSQSRA